MPPIFIKPRKPHQGIQTPQPIPVLAAGEVEPSGRTACWAWNAPEPVLQVARNVPPLGSRDFALWLKRWHLVHNGPPQR